MAAWIVTVKDLQDEVLTFVLNPNQSLSQFCYPENFIQHCENYLFHSPPYGDLLKPWWQRRYSTLNIDGFVTYNCLAWSEEGGSKAISKDVTHEDVENWKIAIRCLQRYCLNLLLAPRRQDFHHIKVSSINMH